MALALTNRLAAPAQARLHLDVAIPGRGVARQDIPIALGVGQQQQVGLTAFIPANGTAVGASLRSDLPIAARLVLYRLDRHGRRVVLPTSSGLTSIARQAHLTVRHGASSLLLYNPGMGKAIVRLTMGRATRRLVLAADGVVSIAPAYLPGGGHAGALDVYSSQPVIATFHGT